MEVLSTNPEGYSASLANVFFVIYGCVHVCMYVCRQKERDIQYVYIYIYTIFVYPWVHIMLHFHQGKGVGTYYKHFLFLESKKKCQLSICDSVVWRRPNLSTDSGCSFLSSSHGMRTLKNTSQVYKGSVCKSDFFENRPLNRSNKKKKEKRTINCGTL